MIAGAAGVETIVMLMSTMVCMQKTCVVLMVLLWWCHPVDILVASVKAQIVMACSIACTTFWQQARLQHSLLLHCSAVQQEIQYACRRGRR